MPQFSSWPGLFLVSMAVLSTEWNINYKSQSSSRHTPMPIDSQLHAQCSIIQAPLGQAKTFKSRVIILSTKTCDLLSNYLINSLSFRSRRSGKWKGASKKRAIKSCKTGMSASTVNHSLLVLLLTTSRFLFAVPSLEKNLLARAVAVLFSSLGATAFFSPLITEIPLQSSRNNLLSHTSSRVLCVLRLSTQSSARTIAIDVGVKQFFSLVRVQSSLWTSRTLCSQFISSLDSDDDVNGTQIEHAKWFPCLPRTIN